MMSEIMDADATSICFALAVALSLFFMYIAMKKTQAPPIPMAPLTNFQKPNGPKNSDVLQNLIDVGATFYGASWCGYTKKQLADLDITETATRGLDYVDCEAQEDTCRSKGVDAYPTWQINGQMYPGYYPASKLVELLSK
jgi:hypothetical protein